MIRSTLFRCGRAGSIGADAGLAQSAWAWCQGIPTYGDRYVRFNLALAEDWARSAFRSSGLAPTGVGTCEPGWTWRRRRAAKALCARELPGASHRSCSDGIAWCTTCSSAAGSARSALRTSTGRPPTPAELAKLYRANAKNLWQRAPCMQMANASGSPVRLKRLLLKTAGARHCPRLRDRAGLSGYAALGLAAQRAELQRRSRLAACTGRGAQAPGEDRSAA